LKNAAICVAKINELCFSSTPLKNTQISPNFTLGRDEIPTSTRVGCEETEEDKGQSLTTLSIRERKRVKGYGNYKILRFEIS